MSGLTHDTAMADAPPSDRDDEPETSEDESEPEAPVDLMVTTRARRPNAGNRMSTLLAKSAEEEEWGEEWEDAPNEEDFRGDDVNEQEDYNMDSSSSEEDDDGGDEDEAGEKELRKAERHEKNKKRKATTNPFAARVAAVTRKKVKLNVPDAHSSMAAPARPKKKSERASWIPTEEDGPIRTSSRKQTVANKENTMAKLKEKDRRRDDTLAMMKAAEARKAKAKEPPLTQAERLAEAARNERINKKTLHRWEEAEEARAAERQAKIDAMKNRQIDGPFVRFYSGPAIWVDEKIKFTGKDAPSLENLEEKLNREFLHPSTEATQPESTKAEPNDPTPEHSQPPPDHVDNTDPSPGNTIQLQAPVTSSHLSSTIPTTVSPQPDNSQMPWTAASQGGGDVFMGSHGMSYPSNTMFAPTSQDSFLFGIDQYAQNQQSQSTPGELPPNPFTQASPYQQQYATSQSPFPQQTHPFPHDPHQPLNGGSNIDSQAIMAQFQRPPPPPAPPRRKVIRRALRNLLILSAFPNLDAPPTLTKSRTPASLIKDKDRSALIQLSSTLFAWSPADATTYINAMLLAAATKPRKKDRDAAAAGAGSAAAAGGDLLALKPRHRICPITNAVARYRDPETGIAYRDARAFGVLRGVVGGGFVWSGDLGCYVGGRAKPLESMGGKGFLGMPPAKNVPRRFWEMQKRAAVLSPSMAQEGEAPLVDGVRLLPTVEGVGDGSAISRQQGVLEVKTESAPVV